jgi:hypothetical protein
LAHSSVQLASSAFIAWLDFSTCQLSQMAPKKLIAGPQLIGKRNIYLLLVTGDHFSFEDVECGVALKEIRRRLPVAGLHIVSPVTVDTVIDAANNDVVMVNYDLLSCWVPSLRVGLSATIGIMVAIRRGLRRLYHRSSADDRKDFYILLLDTRRLQPGPEAVERLCTLLGTSHKWFATPPALVALARDGNIDSSCTEPNIPAKWALQSDMRALYMQANKNYDHEGTFGLNHISTDACLIHSKVVEDILRYGWRCQELQPSLFEAACHSTGCDWQRGSILAASPFVFGTADGGWFSCDQGLSITQRPSERCAIILDFDDYSGFSNRLHLLAFAMTAAHFSGSEVIAIWGWSNQCPAMFADCWELAQWDTNHKCKALTIVERDSEEHKAALQGLSRTEADMFGFGSADTCLHNFVKNINDTRSLEGKTPVKDCWPVLRSYWQLLRPVEVVRHVAEEIFEWMLADLNRTRMLGVHFRRGDLKALMLKQHDRRLQDVSYEEFDQEFFSSVESKIQEGYAVYLAVDTAESMAAWRKVFPKRGVVVMQEDIKHHKGYKWLEGQFADKGFKNGAREFGQLAFAFDVEMLRRCDSFLGTAESSVRQVVMDGRPEPFEDSKLIGVVPYSFLNLCPRLAPAVKKLAFRLAPRWDDGIRTIVGQVLQLSPAAMDILQQIPTESLVKFREALINRLESRVGKDVHGSYLGTVETPPAVEVARNEYKKLQLVSTGKGKKRHLGFLSAVCWTRLRDMCMHDSRPCPLPTGEMFRLYQREEIAGDACLQKFLAERIDTSCCRVVEKEEEEVPKKRKALPLPKPRKEEETTFVGASSKSKPQPSSAASSSSGPAKKQRVEAKIIPDID